MLLFLYMTMRGKSDPDEKCAMFLSCFCAMCALALACRGLWSLTGFCGIFGGFSVIYRPVPVRPVQRPRFGASSLLIRVISLDALARRPDLAFDYYYLSR